MSPAPARAPPGVPPLTAPRSLTAVEAVVERGEGVGVGQEAGHPDVVAGARSTPRQRPVIGRGRAGPTASSARASRGLRLGGSSSEPAPEHHGLHEDRRELGDSGADVDDLPGGRPASASAPSFRPASSTASRRPWSKNPRRPRRSRPRRRRPTRSRRRAARAARRIAPRVLAAHDVLARAEGDPSTTSRGGSICASAPSPRASADRRGRRRSRHLGRLPVKR